MLLLAHLERRVNPETQHVPTWLAAFRALCCVAKQPVAKGPVAKQHMPHVRTLDIEGARLSTVRLLRKTANHATADR